MIKVYDMSSGLLEFGSQDQGYNDEVLYSEHQPVVKDFMEIRLQVVEVTPDNEKKQSINADLADIDCESFISSQDK